MVVFTTIAGYFAREKGETQQLNWSNTYLLTLQCYHVLVWKNLPFTNLTNRKFCVQDV